MVQEINDHLLAAGYEARREELIALQAALATRGQNGGARALLLEGPPGCGKTAFPEAVARALGAPLVLHQLHAWSGDEDLFRGVDVGAAVAGDSEHVHQDGVLAVAARLAEVHDLVVVCLDEIDKAPERAEALLLDWLQSGRVPVRPGEHLSTRLDRVLIVLTTNGQRPLSDALLRRVARVRMRPLPQTTSVRLIHARTGVPSGIVRLLWQAMTAVAAAEGTILSLQEGVHAVRAAVGVCERLDDLRIVLAQWAARTEDGAAAARRVTLAPVWGEIVAARRRGDV